MNVSKDDAPKLELEMKRERHQSQTVKMDLKPGAGGSHL
jgi:hypothetical protein